MNSHPLVLRDGKAYAIQEFPVEHRKLLFTSSRSLIQNAFETTIHGHNVTCKIQGGLYRDSTYSSDSYTLFAIFNALPIYAFWDPTDHYTLLSSEDFQEEFEKEIQNTRNRIREGLDPDDFDNDDVLEEEVQHLLEEEMGRIKKDIEKRKQEVVEGMSIRWVDVSKHPAPFNKQRFLLHCIVENPRDVYSNSPWNLLAAPNLFLLEERALNELGRDVARVATDTLMENIRIPNVPNLFSRGALCMGADWEFPQTRTPQEMVLRILNDYATIAPNDDVTNHGAGLTRIDKDNNPLPDLIYEDSYSNFFKITRGCLPDYLRDLINIFPVKHRKETEHELRIITT